MFNKEKYADLILEKLLMVQPGEALSINTEEEDFEFAKTVASLAVKKTEVICKIVVTNNGKPVDVAEFDPEKPNPDIKSLAMLRLKHSDKNTNTEDYSLPDANDLKAIQKLGLLAEPLSTGRRIIIPWCVVPVSDGEKAEELIEKLETTDAIRNATDYRVQFLNHKDIDKLHFKAPDGSDFTLDVPEGTFFCGGTVKLVNGRKFLSSPDFDTVSCCIDKNSINGTVAFSTKIGNTEIISQLEFKDGKLVGFPQELEHFFSFDEEIIKPGYITMKDKSFNLHMGGCSTDFLSQVPDTEEDIPDFLNKSLFTLPLKLNDKTNITSIGCDGNSNELVRRGFFLD